MAAEYFLERYFKNFALAPFADDIPDQERLGGFKETIENAGFSCYTLPTEMVSRDPSTRVNWAQSRKKLIQSLQQIPKPFAVFAYNDGVGVEVIDACLEAPAYRPHGNARCSCTRPRWEPRSR